MLFIVTASLLYRKKGHDQLGIPLEPDGPKSVLPAKTRFQRGMRIGIALTIVVMEIVKQLFCIFSGNYVWDILPLHLCGMSIFMIAIHTIRPNRFTAEFLYCLSIPGAVAALLFADWTMYPLWNFFCLQSFLIHMLEIAYPVMLLVSGQIRPNARNLWRPAIYLLIVSPPLYYLNKLLDANFFFMNEAAPDSPLSLLQSLLGSPGYIFGTGGLVAIVWFVLYLPIELRRKNRLSKLRAGLDISRTN